MCVDLRYVNLRKEIYIFQVKEDAPGPSETVHKVRRRYSWDGKMIAMVKESEKDVHS